MSDSERVTCGDHGETPATFACRHLTSGVACGYHASGDDPADAWPDAWCDLCEEAFRQAGEWNDESEAVADIKLMCTHCYDAARSRNERPPLHARGQRARLTADEVDALLHHATHEMQAAQAASDKAWGWSAMASWHLDDAGSTLAFSGPSAPSIIADVRLVGSYSTRSNTFQWAWETFEGGAEARDVALLRAFGEVRGIAKLTTATWEAEEADGWHIASLAGYLLGTEAIYRAPFEHTRWFMLLSRFRHAN